MAKEKMKKDKTRILRGVMIAATAIIGLLLLVPLALSFFAFPMPGDDYANVLTTRAAWLSGGGLPGVLAAAFTHALDIYRTLQGNFSGVFVMALNPLLISEGAYQWTLFAINLIFMLSVIWLFWRVIKKRWGMDGRIAVLLAFLLIYVAYNRLMSFIEFGYNFVSASYYTLPFSLALLYLALLLRMNESRKKHTASFVLLILLSAFFGMNNFPLAMMVLAGLGLTTLIAIIKKHRLWKKLLVLFVILVCFLALSLLAPGNNQRENTQWSESFGIVNTLISSLVMGTKLTLIALVSTPLLGVLVLLTPMMAKAARVNRGRFTHPLLMAAATYIVFIVQYIPVLYASGYAYHGRIENIKWVSCLIFIVLNYINLVGYFSQKREAKRPKRQWAVSASVGSILLLLCLWAYYIAPAEINDVLYVHRLHYETIYRQASAGELQTFRQEQAERFDILNDPEVKKVQFQPLTYDAVICGQETLSEDQTFNRNHVLAEFYGKDSIAVLPKE